MTTAYHRSGTERVREKSKGTMWATVQVETVSTCVVGEANMTWGVVFQEVIHHLHCM